MKNYLNFENEIKDLETEIEKLKDPYNQSGLSEVDTQKISKTQNELDEKLKSIYLNLDPWQKTMVARHEDRPKSKFFIDNLFEDFIPLSGDRHYGEDKSVLTGFAKFNNQSVLVIGQEKGDNLENRIERNFGMMKPEGYRKTIRLMELANKFNIPIISLIDTPGAIALASSSKVIMLENAIYSVISPEGCATILWRDPKKMLDAAKAMKLSAQDLLELQIIDEIIKEPLGGAHRDRNIILQNLRNSIAKNLEFFSTMSSDEIFNDRKNKFLKIGRNKGFIESLEDLSSLKIPHGNFEKILKSKKVIISVALLFIVIFFSLFLFL